METRHNEASPRELFRRARDKSIRELSQSFNESRSKSPHSQRLQAFVEIENASPHQHHRNRSASIASASDPNAMLPGFDQNVSIVHGPSPGQSNIVAQSLN